jgi:hypothetical protein
MKPPKKYSKGFQQCIQILEGGVRCEKLSCKYRAKPGDEEGVCRKCNKRK